MISLESISEKTDIGKSYYLGLLSEQLALFKKGCNDCCDENLERLRHIIRSLTYDISSTYNTTKTQALYKCLLSIIANYSGSYEYDPEVVNDGVVIEIITPAPPIILPPEPLMITWSDMVDDENEDGGRSRYVNTLWEGWNPFMQLDNATRLELGVHYNNITGGGFELISDGPIPFIYDGQIIWSDNYAKI